MAPKSISNPIHQILHKKHQKRASFLHQIFFISNVSHHILHQKSIFKEYSPNKYLYNTN